MKIGNEIITKTEKIANQFAKHLNHIARNELCNNAFKIYKNDNEKDIVTIKQNNAGINKQIPRDELQIPIAELKANNSPGSEGIPDEFLKELPKTTIDVLLKICNYICSKKISRTIEKRLNCTTAKSGQGQKRHT